MLLKVNFLLNGFNRKINFLKIILFTLFFKKLFFKNKETISSKVVLLNSPFHFKLPKSHLGIKNTEVNFFIFLKKNIKKLTYIKKYFNISKLVFLKKKKINL